MKKPKIKQILSGLIERYGDRQFQPHHDPLSELILTILSQNTSDRNSRPAFEALKSAFSDWESVMRADTEAVAEAIRKGGLAQIKAGRIQRDLKIILERHGNLSLDFLKDLPAQQARAWLKELPGVGNKTAACVLLFSFGAPVLPVDTHIYRISGRLGLIGPKVSPDAAHDVLGSQVAPEDIYRFHVLMIEHGRQSCTARQPRCQECVVKSMCPSAANFRAKSNNQKPNR